ncbi:MAG: SWIM zinc finger family protein [Nanoarchaeota archaeon]
MSLPKTLRINTLIPPSLATFPSGKTYILPIWKEVPGDTTLEEVQKHWIKKIPRESKDFDFKIRKEISSSNGKQNYIVQYDGMNWSCTCTGFGFRRKCKHIEQIKSECSENNNN